MKVAIPDDVTEIFYRHNPSGRAVALGSTQPVTNEYQEYFLWGKNGRCVGLTTLPSSRAFYTETLVA
jgi:hypothetical protein